MKRTSWVYKINAEKHDGHYRWDRNFFCDGAPTSLSDEGWSSFGADIGHFRSLRQGDLIFAYQVDDKALIGIAETVSLTFGSSGQLSDLRAQPVVQFPKSVPIHHLRQQQHKDSALNQIAAFQERLGRGTLHQLSDSDADTLFEACVNVQHGRNRVYMLPHDTTEIRRLVLGLPRDTGGDWL